jgi:hypothetical protein
MNQKELFPIRNLGGEERLIWKYASPYFFLIPSLPFIFLLWFGEWGCRLTIRLSFGGVTPFSILDGRHPSTAFLPLIREA